MKNAAPPSDARAGSLPPSASPSAFDRALRGYVGWVTRHPWWVIAGVVAATALLGAGLPKIYLANERKLQLPGNDPLVKIDDRILEIFGGGKYTLVGIEAKNGDVFQPRVLEIVKKISDGVAAIPGVDPKDVISLTARKSKAIENGEPGELIVRRLVDKLPTSDAEADVIRKRVMGQPLLRGYLVSDDGKTTAVAADLDDLDPNPDLGNQILTKRFEEVIAPYRHSEEVNVYLSGWPIFQTALDKYTMGILQLLGVAVLVIGLVHLEAFRTFQAMVLPLVTAVLSVTWAMGFLGWTRFPLDAWASLAPFLILAVAAGHAVQILKRYYEEFRRFGENEAAVIESTSRVGGVMITAGLIAAAGFLSLTLFPIRTVQVFGVLTSFGILSALTIEMTFIPACRTLLPAPKVGEVKAESHSGLLETLLERLAAGILARPAGALLLSVAALGVIVYGISRVEVDNSFRRAYPEDEPVYVDDEALSKSFGGTNTMNILVEGDHDDALHDPAVLRAMEGLQQMLTSQPHVGRSQSIVDFLKQMNVAMNDGDESQRVIPESREAIAQLFLLYSGDPDDFDGFVDSNYRKAVVRAYANEDTASFTDDLFARTHAYVAASFPPTVKVSVAGGMLGIGKAMNESVLREKLRNAIVVSAIIFVVASIVLRSLAGGALVLTPTILAALVNMGVMGLVGTYLNLATATITALTISIGADYSIYFLFRFREEHARSLDVRAATLATMLTSGKAIFFVASAIGSGSLVLCLSRLSYAKQLGGYVSLSMVTSALAAVTIVPAFVILRQPAFLRRQAAAASAAATGGGGVGMTAEPEV